MLWSEGMGDQSVDNLTILLGGLIFWPELVAVFKLKIKCRRYNWPELNVLWRRKWGRWHSMRGQVLGLVTSKWLMSIPPLPTWEIRLRAFRLFGEWQSCSFFYVFKITRWTKEDCMKVGTGLQDSSQGCVLSWK